MKKTFDFVNVIMALKVSKITHPPLYIKKDKNYVMPRIMIVFKSIRLTNKFFNPGANNNNSIFRRNSKQVGWSFGKNVIIFKSKNLFKLIDNMQSFSNILSSEARFDLK